MWCGFLFDFSPLSDHGWWYYGNRWDAPTRFVTCDVIESGCSRSVSSPSNHIWKECAGPGLGYWRCGISYGWNLTTSGSRYRNPAPPFASARDAAGTLPGPRRDANRMEVTWLNCATGYNPGSNTHKYPNWIGLHIPETPFRKHTQPCWSTYFCPAGFSSNVVLFPSDWYLQGHHRGRQVHQQEECRPDQEHQEGVEAGECEKLEGTTSDIPETNQPSSIFLEASFLINVVSYLSDRFPDCGILSSWYFLGQTVLSPQRKI